MVSLSAIILAGGQSSRMGQDKALLPIGEIPLLQQICQIALACAHPVYIVTPWVDRYRERLVSDPNSPLAQSCHFVQEHPLPEESIPHGPLVGFAQGLSHVQTDWVLLLACDLPQLKIDVLQSWIALLPQTSAEAIALLPRNPEGWWEPLCGFYHRRCLPSLESYIQQGGRSFQHWLADQPMQELPLSDPAMIFNCNTPQDWQQVQSGHR